MISVLGRFEFERCAEFLNLDIYNTNDQIQNYKIAIMNYTSRRYRDVNAGIRFGETHEKHIRAATLLTEALLWLPIYNNDYVVRYSDLNPEYEEKIRIPGEEITEPGFTSTSADPNFELDVPRNYKLIIKHCSGRYIADYSEHPHEQEVLIRAGATFIVESFDEETQTAYLTEKEKDSPDSENSHVDINNLTQENIIADNAEALIGGEV